MAGKAAATPRPVPQSTRDRATYWRGQGLSTDQIRHELIREDHDVSDAQRAARGEPDPQLPAPAPAKQPVASSKPKPASRPRRSTGGGRARRQSVGPVSVPTPGTPGGVLLAVLLYPVCLAAIQKGPDGARAWFKAKFFNQVSGAGAAAASSVATTSWDTPSARIQQLLATTAPATSAGTVTTSYGAPAGGGSGKASAFVAAAMTQQGKPYRLGTAGPNSYDCSGLVSWAARQVGVTLPHYSQALALCGRSVSAEEILPGDLIVWPITTYRDGRVTGHVQIYIGGGKIVHACEPPGSVVVENVTRRPIIRRVM